MASASCSPISLSSSTFCNTVSDQPVRSPFSRLRSYKAFQHLFQSCGDGIFNRKECSLIGTSSYSQLGRLIGLLVPRLMALRVFIHPRRHDGTEPRQSPLPLLSMALGILRTLQVVLSRSKMLLNFTLLSCLGVIIVNSCSLVPALASNHLNAIMALTTKIDRD